MTYLHLLNKADVFKIGFVCTGNICRSPMAEVYFKKLVNDAGLSNNIIVFSAGTGDWHVGEAADQRTLDTLSNHGLDGSKHRAKQFEPESFELLDLVIVFDRGQERILKAQVDEANRSKIRLLLSFDPEQSQLHDIPDPYYSAPEFFEEVFLMIQKATQILFNQIQPAITKGKP